MTALGLEPFYPPKPTVLFSLILNFPDFQDVRGFLMGDHNDMFNQKAELTNQFRRGQDLGSCRTHRCAEGSRGLGSGMEGGRGGKQPGASKRCGMEGSGFTLENSALVY